MNTINLEQPIFVFYLDIRGTSPQKAKEQIADFIKHHKYDNVTTWVMPVKDPSKVECIYKPNDKLIKLIDKINSIINDYEIDNPELKFLIRDLKIENILEEE
jgi:hypothetical protein